MLMCKKFNYQICPDYRHVSNILLERKKLTTEFSIYICICIERERERVRERESERERERKREMKYLRK